jgi:hypothetical protein
MVPDSKGRSVKIGSGKVVKNRLSSPKILWQLRAHCCGDGDNSDGNSSCPSLEFDREQKRYAAPVVEACRAVTSPFPSRIWFVVAPNLSYLNAPKKHDLRKVSSMSIMSIMVLGQGQYGEGVLMMM